MKFGKVLETIVQTIFLIISGVFVIILVSGVFVNITVIEVIKQFKKCREDY